VTALLLHVIAALLSLASALCFLLRTALGFGELALSGVLPSCFLAALCCSGASIPCHFVPYLCSAGTLLAIRFTSECTLSVTLSAFPDTTISMSYAMCQLFSMST
jgi:hypothetical protein